MEFLIDANENKAEQFVTILKNIFPTDINLLISEEKFYIQCMNSSHTSIIDITLHSTWFKEYRVSKSYNIGLHPKILIPILQSRKKEQAIRFEFDTENVSTDKLVIELMSDSKTVKYEIPTMCVDSELLEIPDADYEADISMPSNILTEIISDMSITSDEIKIYCDSESGDLKFSSSSNDRGSAEASFDDSMIGISMVPDTTIECSYSIGHLNELAKFAKLVPSIMLHLSLNMPLKLLFNLNLKSEKNKNKKDIESDSNIIDTDDIEEEAKNMVACYLAPKIID